MPSPNKSGGAGWPWVAIAALLILFAGGLQEVARAPLATGDAYPPYSSLRADPVGAKALYESLQALPELSVARLYRERAELATDEVLFQLGVDSSAWHGLSKDTLLKYEKMLVHGGRIVFAFLPVNPQVDAARDGVTEAGGPAGRWHICFAYRAAAAGEKTEEGLPRHTALSFTLGPEWRVLAQADGLPVAAERSLGGGSIVAIADSFPLSNEGLRDSRNVALLANILGGKQRVYFDENQLGVSEMGSVAGLIRKYGMESAVAMLLLAAVLFIWRNATSFLPPAMRPAGSQTFASPNTQDGMAALLRRSVTERHLMQTCYDEWARSGLQDGRAAPRIAELQAAAAEREGPARGNPVADYRAACAALSKKNLTLKL